MLFAVLTLAALQASFPAVETDDVQTCKIELVAPTADKNNKLSVLVNAEFVVSIRISNLPKNSCPDVVFARFLRGNSQAGDFIARPTWISATQVEYKTKVRSPKTPGSYDLVVVPSPITASLPGAPSKDKYPKAIKVSVRE